MPWSHQQIQSFPCQELGHLLTEASAENYGTTRRLRQAIQGWTRFIVPHAPSESDITSRGILPDNIANSVTLLLAQTTEGIHPSANLDMKRMVAIWPTIWIWIQLLNERAIHVRKTSSVLSKAQSATERSMYAAPVEAVLFFLGYDNYGTQSVLDELTTAVNRTDGVLQMMAMAWIEEANDERATMGFQASTIYHDSLSHYRPELERLVTASCGGSAKAVAKIAFDRIAHNLHRLRCQHPSLARGSPEMYANLAEDILYVWSIFDDPSSALYASFKSHPGWVIVLVGVTCYLMPPHHPPAKYGAISVAMNTITVYIQKVHSYGGLVELLESPFLDIDVISRATLSGQIKERADDFNGCCVHLIQRMQQFSMYRSILSKTDRRLSATGISTWMEGNEAPIAASLMHLRSQTGSLVKAYGDFRGGVTPIFCCGNRECNSTDSGHVTLYRCRGCKLALYCGVDCQKQDWRGAHKLLCNAMKQPGQALPPLSSPDLRWLAYILAREFIQVPFTPSGLTACDSAGRFTSLLLLNRGSAFAQTLPERSLANLNSPSDMSAMANTNLVPSGGTREAWRRCLKPRHQSGHSALPAATTVAVLLVLPPQAGETPASITALLTFPAMESVLLEEVHITWVFHQ